jgi:hypothetical protein
MRGKALIIAGVAVMVVGALSAIWWTHRERTYLNTYSGGMFATDMSLQDALSTHHIVLPADATGTRYAARTHNETDSPLILSFNSSCSASEALAQSIAPRLTGESAMPDGKVIWFAQSVGWAPSATDEWYAKITPTEEHQVLVGHRADGACTTYIASYVPVKT